MTGNFARMFGIGLSLALAVGAGPVALAHADTALRGRQLLEAMRELRPDASADRSKEAAPQHVDGQRDCRGDASGDTTDDRADILAWCAYYDDTELRVALGLLEGTSPYTHPSWDGTTAAGWMFDTAGDDSADYTAMLLQAEGHVGVFMFDADGSVVCQAERFVADLEIYEAVFDADCLGGADDAQVLALMLFDANPGSGNLDDLHMDIAPNTGPLTLSRHTHTAPTPSPTPSSAPAPTPVADGLRSVGRLAGPDRITTAVAISQRAFPEGASVVYLARQDLNPDALVAGALTDGPVLLVPACGALPPAVADEIRRLGAHQVFALGGAGSVCQEILDQAARA